MTGIYLKVERERERGSKSERKRERENERDPRAFILLTVGTSAI